MKRQNRQFTKFISLLKFPGLQYTVKLGLYVHGLVRALGYYVLFVDHGHRQSDIFALSLFWIKRTLLRTYLFSFPLRVRNNRVSLCPGEAKTVEGKGMYVENCTPKS